MRPFPALLLLAFVLASLSGCITGRMPAQQINVKRLDISAQNLSELVSMEIPLQCLVKNGNETVLVRMKNGTMRAEAGSRALFEDRGTLYMQVPESRKQEFDCDWVMVNKTDDVFSEWLSSIYPFSEDLDSIPAQKFVCDSVYVKDSEFYPSGKICWYFDLNFE
jgi:hypothetical protein